MASPPSMGKTSSNATYFYIGDSSTKSPVVLHCFRARCQHQQELPLKPSLVFAEACLSLVEPAGQRVITVESPLPENHFFGELPGAFVENRPATSRVLWSLLRAQRCAEGSSSQEVAWACRAEAVLGPLTFLALWGFGPCYRQHTRRAVLRGTCLAAWPVAWLHCWRLRQRARLGAGPGFTPRRALQEREMRLRNFLDEWQSFRTEEDTASGISLDELTTLAYVRCLAAIPEALSPLDLALQQRLRELSQALQLRLAASRRLVAGDVAPVRWTEAEEAGAATKIEGTLGQNATVSSDRTSPLSALWQFLHVFLREKAPKDEDVAVPMSAMQRRGNWIFLAWLVSSSALFATASLFAPRQRGGNE